MRVKVSQLVAGCIIAQDVAGLSGKAIIPKKTILKPMHLEVLHAFLVKDVYVEPLLATGEPFEPSEVLEEQEVMTVSASFSTAYLQAVKEYKRMFQQWQSGLPVDIGKIRALALPLLEKALNNYHEIFLLHHYSTKEEYLYHHSISVALLSGFLAKKLGRDTAEVNQVALAGLLSDCGMAKLDLKILLKPQPLTQHEYEQVKEHPSLSYNMIRTLPAVTDAVKLSVFQHQERIDGSGYPMRVKGDQLHPFSLIISVADVYQAMTSERPHRRKNSPFKVLEQMMQDDFGKFDLRVLEALASGIVHFSGGTRVKLSNGNIAEIIYVDNKYPTRPLVKLLATDEFIQLEKHRHLFIEEIL